MKNVKYKDCDLGFILRWNYTHNQKMTYFVLYLKIINLIFDNNICIL